MDSNTIYTLVTGSGGAMVALILWIRSLQAQHVRLEKLLDTKDAENGALTEKVVALATDVQRSLNEKSGCRFQSHLMQTPHKEPE